jgi:hypothetical protein
MSGFGPCGFETAIRLRTTTATNDLLRAGTVPVIEQRVAGSSPAWSAVSLR